MFRTASAEGFPVLPDYQMDLLEAACDWAFITDEAFIICYTHKCRGALGEILPQNLICQPLTSFLPAETRLEVMQVLRGDNKQKKTGAETVYIDPLTGPYRIKSIPLDYSYFQGYAITVRRISDEDPTHTRTGLYGDPSQTIDQRIALQLRRQKLIADLALEFAKNTHADLEELFFHTLETLGSFMGVDRCSIFRHDLENRTYSILYEWCAPNVHSTKALLQNIPYNDDDEGFIQLTTRPYIAVDDTFQYSGEAYRVQRESGVHSFVDLPILANGKFWGFLGADYGSGPHYWTDSEFHMLQTIGSMMSSTLEKREIEDKLYDTYSKLSEIVDNYPGIIWAVDKNNVLTFLEGRSLSDLGVSKESLLGTCVDDLAAGPDPSDIIKQHNATFTHGNQSYYADIDGRHYTCETTLMHTLNEEISGVVGVALDVTDMQQMQNQLENAILQAEQASQAKTEFLSRMSHEIRTPMNAIIGMNEIAQNSSDPQRIQYCLAQIEQSSHQLLNIINDILDLAKIESGKMEIRPAEFDFEGMLQKAYDVIQPRVEEKGVSFSFDLENHCDRYVISDELHLTQILVNLFSNAIKFTAAGGKITLRSRFLNRQGNNALLRVEVQDTGIGISPEDQKKLFQSFEQADGSITRRFGGTGLGLSICKKILTLMEGNIWVESQLGQGSNFIFEVDISWGDSCMDKPETLPVLHNTRALVLDDNPDTLEYCRQIISGFQMHCDVASSGEAAIAMVKQSTRPYNIIFLDGNISGPGCLHIAQALGEILPSAAIILMISASGWDNLKQQAARIGVTDFLVKPILPSVLFNAIIKLTGDIQSQTQKQKPIVDYFWPDKSILVAEDIAINREILCILLEPTGITIECADNGREAVQMFSAHPTRYDLILMDIQMPEMDGYEATRQLRASGHENAASIPILAMTANAFSEDVEKCLAAGMNSHISKPIDVNELLEKLHAALPSSGVYSGGK